MIKIELKNGKTYETDAINRRVELANNGQVPVFFFLEFQTSEGKVEVPYTSVIRIVYPKGAQAVKEKPEVFDNGVPAQGIPGGYPHAN